MTSKPDADVYVVVPPTPGPKLSRAAQYALEPPFRERENPVVRASLLSAIAYQWLQPLISLGAQKVLDKEDLWPVAPQDACDALETRFAEQYARSEAGPWWWSSRFAVALVRTFQREYVVIIANYTVYLASMVLQPFLVQAMLDYLNDRTNIFHINSGYVLVVLMAIVSFIGVTCLNYGVFILIRVCSNMRSIVMNEVYQKALRLSCVARQAYTTGEIVTLMSVDSERVFYANLDALWLVFAPLAFVITIIIVASMFDVVAAVCGAVLLVIVVSTSVRLAKKIGYAQRDLLRVVEERVKVTSEALQGIRVMKFYAWEESLARRVERIRSFEIQLYRRFHFLNIMNSTLLFLTPVLLGAVIFGVYIARKGTLTVTDAFTLIAMVNISRLGVSLFPKSIALMSQALIVFRRLDEYMASDEITSSDKLLTAENTYDRNGSILVRNATFVWSEEDGNDVPSIVVVPDESLSDGENMDAPEPQPRFALEALNMDIEAGSLVMIVGTVGSGKTSLLHAILGEMLRKGGDCEVHGELSYVSQEAWIRNATMKDNILFESPFNNERYEQVLEATQLALDLHALPNGDQTEIGERGINLSGGQKARVAIARAVYRQNYDILVLDDPLSAVDPHVAHAIFEQCIVGFAGQKTRLLVLNSHYDLLQHADKILVIQHGRIVGDGTYRDIVAQFPSLDTYKQELDKVETDVIDEHESVAVEKVKAHDAAHEAAFGVASTDVIASSDEVAHVDVGPLKPSGSSKLVQEEDRVRGRVSGGTYRTYFDETGFHGIAVIIVIISLYAGAQGMRVSADYWQGYWAKQMPRKIRGDSSYSDSFYAWWYFGFFLFCIVLAFARGVVLIDMCMRSAKNMHDELFRRVLRAPVNRYFDVTPVGRILNRFSNDLDQLDANLPQYYQAFLEAFVSVLGALVVCAFASYWIAVSYIPMLFIFVVSGLYFKKSSREIKRLEGVSRTPVFNLFSETLNGLHTIRAFRMQRDFVRLNKRVVDENTSYYFHFWIAGRWLAVRLDWLSVVVILVVSLYIVSSKGSIAPIVAGLSITYSLTLTTNVQWVVRTADTMDNAMTSVERLLAFREIPTEDDGADCVSVNTEAWPSQGSIKFDQLCLKYRPELPLVLRGVEMEIDGGEKVGICGRTGAGKSSLMIALFRICEFESGTVWIDGLDISQLKLQELRRALAIIPQDPVLYSGSLRENLDPFEDYADDAIWNVLRQVHLADAVNGWGAGLEFMVSERGDNLSVGQRQLLCIGRALLKNSKIVVLDEATANVDTATDNLIQTTIQETFQDKTVLIIAHRINTIMHCNKIAVMDAGRVAEFGSPTELLAQSNSIFASLAKRSTQKKD